MAIVILHDGICRIWRCNFEIRRHVIEDVFTEIVHVARFQALANDQVTYSSELAESFNDNFTNIAPNNADMYYWKQQVFSNSKWFLKPKLLGCFGL